MNILLLTQYFWPENFPINAIARDLVKRGHRVSVLTSQPNYPEGVVYKEYNAWGIGVELYEGVKISRLPILPRGKGAFRLGLNYISFVLSALLIGPWRLRRKDIDVIFVYAPSPIFQAIPAIFLGYLWRKPIVLWVQDLWPESLVATRAIKSKLVLNIVGWIVQFVYRHVQLLLVQSEAFVGPIKKISSSTPVLYLPNPADDIFASINETNSSLMSIQALKNSFVVMFAGNLGSAQSLDVIVQAAKLLKSESGIQIVIVGDGSRKNWLQEQVEINQLTNIHLLGRHPIEVMPSLMQQANALLVTLSRQPIFELTVPSKLQNYFAAGRPIIASIDGEAARLVLKSGAGLVAPSEDPLALRNVILEMYHMNCDQREAMGKAGRGFYRQHFQRNLLIDQLLIYLQNSIESQSQ